MTITQIDFDAFFMVWPIQNMGRICCSELIFAVQWQNCCNDAILPNFAPSTLIKAGPEKPNSKESKGKQDNYDKKCASQS